MNEEQSLYRYKFGNAEFDQANMTLSVDGAAVKLEQRPMQVLAVLLERANQAVTREQLLDRVWGDIITEDGSLSTAIAKLRRVLGDSGATLIVTQPRFGYRLQASVERIEAGQRQTNLMSLAAGTPVPTRKNFRLEQPLGLTGSHVWLARHLHTRESRVYKFAGDDERLRSIKREATLYRVLLETLGERNDYVRLLDWNFESPPYFLECEYGGISLLEWAVQEGGQLARLSLQERLDLFLQVADSVADAHGVGVLHKDLKPANILVELGGSGWRTRLTDFGSGRLLNPDRLKELGITELERTQNASASGTALYLAPELIAGHSPTVQSDVYALGVVLYQLLLGDLRHPIVPGWEQGIDHDLLKEDIAAATDGNPARRLASVADLARRLRSLDQRLADHRQSEMAMQRALLAEKAMDKARARRPWILGLIASLGIGLVISWGLYWRVVTAANEAHRQATRAEAVNRFLNDDLLKSADPSAPGSISNPTLRDVLRRAADRLDQQFLADDVTKATISLSLGDSYFGLSDYDRAIEFQSKAVGLFQRSVGASAALTLEAQYELVRTLDTEGRYQEAEKLLDQTDHGLSAVDESEPRLALLAAWTRGGHELRQMKPAEALSQFEALEALRKRYLPDDQFWLIRTRQDLAWCYVRLNRAADAERSLRELMDARYTPETIGAFEWAKARYTYATALTRLARYPEAEALLKDSVQQLKPLLGDKHYVVGLGLEYLSAVCQAENHWSEALSVQQESYAVYRASVGESAGATLVAGSTIGVIQAQLGQRDLALNTLSSSLKSVEQTLGPNSPFAEDIKFHYADVLKDVGRFAQAQALIQQIDPAKLAIAEPGYDWPSRLSRLAGEIAGH